jgi:chaperonin cofactor prefoldin
MAMTQQEHDRLMKEIMERVEDLTTRLDAVAERMQEAAARAKRLAPARRPDLKLVERDDG